MSVPTPTIKKYSTDTGVLGDGITSDNTLTLSGLAQALNTIEIYASAKFLGDATADIFGAWTFNTAALLDGTYNLTAVAMDLLGNTSPASSRSRRNH